MIIWCLLLFVTSAFSRTTVDHQEDVSNNLITCNKPVQTDSIISNYEEQNTLDNSVLPNNVVLTHGVNETTKIKNVLSVSHNADRKLGNEVHNVDNGTALILTQYIKEGKLIEARKACKVDSENFLGFESYSGFLTVNETYNSNLYFWYFPVLNKSVNDSPWIIWMQGGPGVSSLLGLFDEIGPITYKNGRLRPNPYTWLRNHSLLFIDSPVGTGYSFTDHDDGYPTGDMTLFSSHLYTALRQFLQIFPELKTVPLYLAGESYAGKYVPALAMEIHKGKDQFRADINLQGMILGNALLDPEMIHIPWSFYYLGMLDRKQAESLKPLEDGIRQDIAANRSLEAKNKFLKLGSILMFVTHQYHGFNFLRDEILTGSFSEFLQRSEVKRALHVGDIQYSVFNSTVSIKMVPDFITSTKPFMEILLENYRALLYCGQLDQMLGCMFASEFYRTWRWNGSQEFLQASRYPYIYKTKLCGYHKSGGNLTEVVVRGAGHLVPYDVPAPAQNMVAQFTHERPISEREPIYDWRFLQDIIKNQTIVHYL